MLKEEFQYYLNNQNDLVKLYKGKFLVIVGQAVVGAYRSMKEAATKAAKKYQLGTFLIQECSEGEDAYTQEFYNINYRGQTTMSFRIPSRYRVDYTKASMRN